MAWVQPPSTDHAALAAAAVLCGVLWQCHGELADCVGWLLAQTAGWWRPRARTAIHTDQGARTVAVSHMPPAGRKTQQAD